MAEPSRNKSKRRPPAGEVIGATVAPHGPQRPERPVVVQCEGHDHHYEIAWADTDEGPVVTDMRVFSPNGAPITKRTLARINPERIAAAAKRAETEEAANTWRDVRRAVEDLASSYGLPTKGFEWLETYRPTTAGLLAAAERQGVLEPRRRGRPSLPREHFEEVAELARKAREDVSRSVARYIAQNKRYPDGSEPALETVHGWLKRCRQLGLIKPGELRKPKQ